MTRTEERLADALGAAARALREDTLRPLVVPERQERREGPRRRPALAAPLAAAAALLLVVGIAVVAARYLPGSGPPAIPVTGLPRYYVDAQPGGDRPVVRSTATGAVTATVPVPRVGTSTGSYLIAASVHGVFFAAVPLATGERVYWFRLTAAGRVGRLAEVPGGGLPGGQWTADAMAASPDGSRVALSMAQTGGFPACDPSGGACTSASPPADRIYVVSTATGATSVWQGGTGRNFSFGVLSLSWTGDGQELVYYGQWCPQPVSNPGSSTAILSGCLEGTSGGGARTEVWALNPASGGGRLDGGRRLLSLTGKYPYVLQVRISPDGSAITAVVLTQGAGFRLEELTVERIPLARGERPSVLYSLDLGSISALAKGIDYLYPLTLSPDGAGQHWLLGGTFCGGGRCSGGFNGWIDGGLLVPLQPGDGGVASEAW